MTCYHSSVPCIPRPLCLGGEFHCLSSSQSSYLFRRPTYHFLPSYWLSNSLLNGSEVSLAETLLHSEKKKINPQFPFISHYLLPFCFVFLSIKTLSTLLTNIVVVISFLSTSSMNVYYWLQWQDYTRHLSYFTVHSRYPSNICGKESNGYSILHCKVLFTLF